MIRNYRVVWMGGPDLSWYGKTHGPGVKSPTTNGAGAVFFSACPYRSQSLNRAWMSCHSRIPADLAGAAPLVPKHAIAVRRSGDPAGDTRRHEAEQQKMTSFKAG